MPYWFSETLAALPAFLWIFFGLGIPWSLVILPRRDWRLRTQVIAVSMVAGSVLLSIWMFILGTIGAATGQALLRFDLVITGTVIIAGVGIVWAWRKRRPSPEISTVSNRPSLRYDELLLIGLITAALCVRWIVIAYWTFTAYDTLWVYGYEGRSFFANGVIPNDIGYYPLYLPLQYTFGQLAYGSINDHAARAGLFLLHLLTILSVYVLGDRLFKRRVGIYAAAIWALYPHVGEWARAGDLEILLAGLFTLAAAFLLLAWIGEAPRKRYAVIGGLFIGVGLWTKPTMGAFLWGLALLGAIEFLRVRFKWRDAWQRWQLILIALFAAIPLGALWYVRNALLGLEIIELPSGFWLTLAARSGAEFGWLLLALFVYIGYITFAPQLPRPNWWLLLPGIALILLGIVPSIVSPHRMEVPEWIALFAGAVLTGMALIAHALKSWTAQDYADGRKIGWALLLALPFFVTWFYSYSYHYRLSFPMVPLLILPTALIIVRWLEAVQPRQVLKWAVTVGIISLSLPGIVSTIYDPFVGWNYLWSGQMPDDHTKYASGNAALMTVVDGLQVWVDEHPNETLDVLAPGILRLPFFFADQNIVTDQTPTQLSAVEAMDYIVYGVPEGVGTYEAIPITENQVVGSLGRQDILRRAWGFDDGTFRYDVYEPQPRLTDRSSVPPINAPAEGEVIFGDVIQYLGHDLGGLEFWPGRRLVAHLYWQPVGQPQADYSIFIHLLDGEGNLITTWDGVVSRSPYGYYSTRVWEVGEVISDERIFQLPDATAPVGEGYQLVIGVYDPLTMERLPVMINAEPAGDSLVIENRIAILPFEPS
jgi:hypothetical protein